MCFLPKKIVYFSLLLILPFLSHESAAQTFRYPLPELIGQWNATDTINVKKQIGVFRDISDFHLEVAGSTSHAERTVPGQLGETASYPASLNASISSRCIPYYASDWNVPSSPVILEDGNFSVKFPLLNVKKQEKFLSEGNGVVEVWLRLDAVGRYSPRSEVLRRASLSVTNATLVVEAEERIGDEAPLKNDHIKLPVLFSAGHINFAWGYKDRGIVVDADGNVFLYDNACRGPRYLTGTEVLTDDLMRASFTMTKHVKKIKPVVLRKMKSLVPAAAKGSLSRAYSGADRGFSGAEAYLYDRKSGTYTEIDLGGIGDYSIKNASPAAQTLRNWLSKLREEVEPRF